MRRITRPRVLPLQSTRPRTACVFAAALLGLFGPGLDPSSSRDPVVSDGTTVSWSRPGLWFGVAGARDGRSVSALRYDGTGRVLGSSGEELGELRLPGWCGHRVKVLHAPTSTEFLTYSKWIGDLRCFDVRGVLLWTYPKQDGIDDVWTGDLDGDGIDEVVVGHNGSTGLQVLDADGRLLWGDVAVGNVWSVSGGSLCQGGATTSIVAASRGSVHVYTEGWRREVETSIHTTLVRVAAGSDGSPPRILAGSTPRSRVFELQALHLDGSVFWTLELPAEGPTFTSAAVDATSGLLAVATSGGVVHVVDTLDGRRVATRCEMGDSPELAWTRSEGGEPVLVVATGGALVALSIDASRKDEGD